MRLFDKYDILLTFCLGGLVSLLVSVVLLTKAWETDCVHRGAAEWVVADDGTTEFHWLLEPTKEKP